MKKRAFVRYSKQGKIVPGSLILTSGSHPNGPSTWKEVPADLCAGPILDSADSGLLASFPWNSFPVLVVYCNETNQYFFAPTLDTIAPPENIEHLVSELNTYASTFGTFSVAPGGQSILLNLSPSMAKDMANCKCDLSFEVFPD
jgi:hypothetical protein